MPVDPPASLPTNGSGTPAEGIRVRFPEHDPHRPVDHSRSPSSPPRATRLLGNRTLVVTGFLVLYVVAFVVGRATRTEGSQIALAWPAAGVGVWFLASMRGRGEILLAVCAVTTAALLVNISTGFPLMIGAVFAVVNSAHAVTGLILLRRLLPAPTGISEPGQVVRLLLVAFGAAAVSGSTSAVAAAGLLGEPFWSSLLLFLVRNGGTTFVVLAAVQSVSAPQRLRDLVARHRVVELTVIAVGSTVTYLIVFAAPGQLPILFIALGTSVLAGTRLGVARSGVLGLLLCGVAVTGTVLGHGALAGVEDVHTRAVLVQVFTVHVLVVSLSLATLQQAKDALAAELTASLALLREANDSALIGKAVAVRGGDGGWCLTTPNPALVGLLGRDPSGLRWGQFIHLDDRVRVRAALDDIAAGARARYEGEVRHSRPGDIWVWTQLHISRLMTPDGASAVVVQVQDISGRRAEQDELVRRANHDPLTGLPNRSMLQRDLDLLLTRPGGSAQPGASVAVLFVDLDRFKRVNDTYGHDAGDTVLVQVAAAVRTSLRPGDLVSRLGGDEFVVCCPGVSEPSQAAGVVARLRAAVAPALLLHGQDVGLDVSVGVAISTPGQGARDLLRTADAAMYVNKRRPGPTQAHATAR